jgi:opacity protein-like surface antigen
MRNRPRCERGGLKAGVPAPPHVTEIDMKKKILIAAGLLCLGAGPAFAFTIPPMAPDMAKAVKEVWTDQMAAEQPGVFDTGEAWMGEAKSPKMLSAAADSFDDSLAAKSDDGFATSGPSEAVMDTNALPAAAAYPPCRPGAGDDHCIQLYEPGVRAQLAGWNRSATGSETAMGGPYEPVDSTLAGEMGGTATPAGAQYAGIRGPREATAYPRCSRTVTDSCIQR